MPALPSLLGLAARLHTVAQVRSELTHIAHALTTLASEWERAPARPLTTRDAATLARLCGRMGLTLVAHWQLTEVRREPID